MVSIRHKISRKKVYDNSIARKNESNKGGVTMALEQRIESLRKRHAHIETLLQQEENRPAPDIARVQELKKEKLALKDEIARLEVEKQEAA